MYHVIHIKVEEGIEKYSISLVLLAIIIYHMIEATVLQVDVAHAMQNVI